MILEKENPGTLAGAHRVDVTELASKNDCSNPTVTAVDLQVRKVLRRYAVSLPVAIVIAEAAFSRGRSA